MSVESSISPWHRSGVWVAFLVAVAGAAILGANWDKLIAKSEKVEHRLTKASYAKLKPGTDLEEVRKLLGPGNMIKETTKIITAKGKFTEHSWDGRNHRQRSGEVHKHDGKPSEETGKEIEWHEGDRLI